MIIMSPPRVFPILCLLLAVFAFFFANALISFSKFANASPSNVDSKKAMDDDQDWTKLTECNDFLAAVKRSSNGYRRCILDRIRDSSMDATSPTFERAVNACSSAAPWRCLDIRRLPSHHYAIPPPPPSHSIVDAPPAECVAVFLGNEQNFVDKVDSLKDVTPTGRPELLDLAPGCRLHLADAIDHRNFTSIGQYHPVSVSISSRRITRACKVLLTARDQWYVNSTCIEIKEFLETLQDAQRKPFFIDYLWIDFIWRDGSPEDRGLTGGLFADSNMAYSILMDEPRGVTICQIVIGASSDSDSNSLIANILEKSSFIPLRSQSRQFWFNVASPYCVAKYIAPRFEVTSCGRMATVRNEKAISGQFEIDTELIRVE